MQPAASRSFLPYLLHSVAVLLLIGGLLLAWLPLGLCLAALLLLVWLPRWWPQP